MALQKPQASKAPAPVQPMGGYHSQSAKHDPCCIPAGAFSGAPQNGSSNAKDDPSFMGAVGTLGAIVNPTAH